jgi:2-amino-4-hydroxy-6-hydroxymethyldihydropteridine diphosphokinase
VARVYVSIGSNIAPAANIRSAVARLRRDYGPLILSPVYESKAVGFEGDNFYNLVAGFDTDDGVTAVDERLRAIEQEHGRVRGEDRFSGRPLDLDLLLYGDSAVRLPGLTLPRPEITRYAFVLLPLSEIAPDERHPLTGRRYADLWTDFDARGQRLWRADFTLEP